MQSIELLIMTDFADLPFHSQVLVSALLLLVLYLGIRMAVATFDYVMEGRESREKRRERKEEHRFDWLRILWGKNNVDV